MRPVSIQCPDCKMFNDMFAEVCIHCGAPLPKTEYDDDEEDDDD